MTLRSSRSNSTVSIRDERNAEHRHVAGARDDPAEAGRAQSPLPDLRRWEAWTPVELLGTVHFPMIGELPYLLTLAGHGFLWFRLTPPEGNV